MKLEGVKLKGVELEGVKLEGCGVKLHLLICLLQACPE